MNSGNNSHALISFVITTTIFLILIVSMEVAFQLLQNKDLLEDETKPIRTLVVPSENEGPLSLKSEQFEIKNNDLGRFESNVRNEVRDNDDTREKSSNESTSHQSNSNNGENVQDADQVVRALEAQLLNNTGGAAEREKIQQKIREVKANAAKNNNNSGSKPTNNKENQYSGNVLVEYKIYNQSSTDRSGNMVPAPGYTCKQGSGKVYIDIQINNAGKIITATYNASKSSNASQCMISKALEYAKKSSFSYNSNSQSRQGYILYTFVSQ